MSENNRKFGTFIGTVQEFPNQDIIGEREVSGQTVREFTIRSGINGGLAKVTVWPEHEEFEIQKGQLVGIDGSLTTNEKNGTTYRNISATTISLGVVVPRAERTVVNKKTETADEDLNF